MNTNFVVPIDRSIRGKGLATALYFQIKNGKVLAQGTYLSPKNPFHFVKHTMLGTPGKATSWMVTPWECFHWEHHYRVTWMKRECSIGNITNSFWTICQGKVILSGFTHGWFLMEDFATWKWKNSFDLRRAVWKTRNLFESLGGCPSLASWNITDFAELVDQKMFISSRNSPYILLSWSGYPIQEKNQ